MLPGCQGLARLPACRLLAPVHLKGAGKATVDQLRSLGQLQQLREPVP